MQSTLPMLSMILLEMPKSQPCFRISELSVWRLPILRDPAWNRHRGSIEYSAWFRKCPKKATLPLVLKHRSGSLPGVPTAMAIEPHQRSCLQASTLSKHALVRPQYGDPNSPARVDVVEPFKRLFTNPRNVFVTRHQRSSTTSHV